MVTSGVGQFAAAVNALEIAASSTISKVEPWTMRHYVRQPTEEEIHLFQTAKNNGKRQHEDSVLDTALETASTISQEDGFAKPVYNALDHLVKNAFNMGSGDKFSDMTNQLSEARTKASGIYAALQRINRYMKQYQCSQKDKTVAERVSIVVEELDQEQAVLEAENKSLTEQLTDAQQKKRRLERQIDAISKDLEASEDLQATLHNYELQRKKLSDTIQATKERLDRQNAHANDVYAVLESLQREKRQRNLNSNSLEMSKQSQNTNSSQCQTIQQAPTVHKQHDHDDDTVRLGGCTQEIICNSPSKQATEQNIVEIHGSNQSTSVLKTSYSCVTLNNSFKSVRRRQLEQEETRLKHELEEMTKRAEEEEKRSRAEYAREEAEAFRNVDTKLRALQSQQFAYETQIQQHRQHVDFLQHMEDQLLKETWQEGNLVALILRQLKQLGGLATMNDIVTSILSDDTLMNLSTTNSLDRKIVIKTIYDLSTRGLLSKDREGRLTSHLH